MDQKFFFRFYLRRETSFAGDCLDRLSAAQTALPDCALTLSSEKFARFMAGLNSLQQAIVLLAVLHSLHPCNPSEDLQRFLASLPMPCAGVSSAPANITVNYFAPVGTVITNASSVTLKP